MSSNIYRFIWTQNFGKIPVDENGRTYEIHHIDGNRSNNDISNLQCVSIDEHYKIHYEQGDYYACYLIKLRMEYTSEELSHLMKKSWSCPKRREQSRKMWKEYWAKESNRKAHSKLCKTLWTEERKKKASITQSKKAIQQIKNGEGVWFNKEAQKKKSIKMKGENNPAKRTSVRKKISKRFKNKVPVINKDGKYLQISKDVYSQQTGPIESWEYVAIRSAEAKRRKEIKIKGIQAKILPKGPNSLPRFSAR